MNNLRAPRTVALTLMLGCAGCATKVAATASSDAICPSGNTNDRGIAVDPLSPKGSPKTTGSIEVWNPPDGATTTPRYIDLSEYLPPVQKQTAHDCTAWASAYYLRSALWAARVNRSPREATHQFSPLYLYSLIALENDGGSYLRDALQTMRTTGAATLAKVPLFGDHSTRRDHESTDAADHRVLNYFRIESREAIVLALSVGLPVLVHIITDASFNSGVHDVYDVDLRNAAAQLRRERPRAHDHGRHSMLIVGYDPDRCAFKLVNSWGPDWGRNRRDPGFAWADCRLFDTIEFDHAGENFAQEAFVVTAWCDDEASCRTAGVAAPPVAPKPRPPQLTIPVVPPLTDAEATKLFEAVRLDARDLTGPASFEPTHRWRLEMSGDDRIALRSATLDADSACIRRPHRYDCDFPKDRHGGAVTDIVYTLGEHPSQQRHERLIKLDAFRKAGSLKLVNDSYVLFGACDVDDEKTQQLFNWTIRVDASPEQLQEIVRVTYVLHHTFKKRRVKVKLGRESGFPLSAIGWGEFTIKAIIHKRDGTRERLKHWLEIDKRP